MNELQYKNAMTVYTATRCGGFSALSRAVICRA